MTFRINTTKISKLFEFTKFISKTYLSIYSYMKINIEKIIYEEMGLLKEYSQKILVMLATKFRKENPALTDEQIKYYIDGFDRVKSSPKVTNKDITRYTFAELEKTVDAFPKKGSTTINKAFNTAEVKGEEIYAKNNIEVYLGDERDKCVKYRAAFQGDTNQQYGWCIARSDSSNLYTSYRYGLGDARIFYFVIDRNKPVTDPLHVFVVHVFDDGRYGYTDARNDGDNINLSWQQMVEYVPALRGVPQNIFKPKPLTAAEQALYDQTVENTLEDDLFAHFNNNYNLVKSYIEIHNHYLTSEQITTLINQRHFDIINLYINGGKTIHFTLFKLLPDPLLKNYARVGNQIMEQGVNLSVVTIPRFVLMYNFGYVDEERFVGIIKNDYRELNGTMIGEITQMNQLNTLKLLFSWMTTNYSIEMGEYPKNIQILFAQSGRDYIKNNFALDMEHAKMMWANNIDGDLADDWYPNERLLPQMKLLNPDIQKFIIGYRYANNTIAIVDTLDGNTFVNKQGQEDTNGITVGDLSRMGDIYIRTYFRIRFNVNYEIEKYYQKNPAFAKPYAILRNLHMFIGPDNRGDISGIDFNKMLENKKNSLENDIGAYANAFLNKFYYQNIYFRSMMPKGLTYKKEMALGYANNKYFIVDPQTWKPSLDGVKLVDADDSSIKSYNNTIEAMKDFQVNSVPLNKLLETYLKKLLF